MDVGAVGKSWDLIVVGAGSAGAALAARCADRGGRVLVVEAGPDYRSAEMDELWRSPNTVRATYFHPEGPGELVWRDLVATRTNAQAPQFYWRGRGVGGSSSINGQIAIRPPRDDYDSWAAAGCEGWSWEEVLPFFCRLESDAEFGREPYHGDSGPIPVYRTPRDEWGSVDEALARAAGGRGFSWAGDVNAPGATGVSPYPINSRDRRRVSTNDGYLEPRRGLENLSILGYATADRVVVRGGRAIGVELVHEGRRRVEYGDEIVVCAGAIHTPGILIRSGIGPVRQLAELGLDAVAELPVGEGLQDHALVAAYLLLRPEATIKTPDDRDMNCCVRFDSEHADGVPNDLMVISINQMPLPAGSPGTQAAAADAADMGVWLSPDTEATAADAGALCVWLNAPYSRGTIGIASADPQAPPVVHEQMLSDERDLRRFRHGVRLLADLMLSDDIAEICSVSPREANPALWHVLDDDAKLDQYLLATVTDAMHATSTCRMGPADSPSSVVDTHCRVLGVEGLRVADASIFPSCPRANTNLASIAVGELVADLLA
ncbi:MAG TPA: GMC family oxidoreductase [Gaiellaceae bacterium]|jgi:choline dehydrogenase